jgi:hypothetical protein
MLEHARRRIRAGEQLIECLKYRARFGRDIIGDERGDNVANLLGVTSRTQRCPSRNACVGRLLREIWLVINAEINRAVEASLTGHNVASTAPAPN